MKAYLLYFRSATGVSWTIHRFFVSLSKPCGWCYNKGFHSTGTKKWNICRTNHFFLEDACSPGNDKNVRILKLHLSAFLMILRLKRISRTIVFCRSHNVNNPLPPTIVDQIRLWEMERNRLTFSESVLYNQFLSHRDYEVVRDYAQEIGVLLHSSDQKRTVVVKGSGHDDVKRFWKRHSKTS